MQTPYPFKRGEETQTLLHNARAAAPFHSPTGVPWLSIPIGPVSQTAIPLRSRQAQLWISANFFAEYECAPSPAALRRAIHTLEAQALYHGPERPVGRRLTSSGNKIVLDLANEDNQTVEIGSQGWTTTDDLTCSFERDPQTGALAEPQATEPGTNPLEDLRNLLGITNETHWTRILIWLLAALRPVGPYPILVIDGPAGTGKSTLARCLKSILDPGPETTGRIRIYDVHSRPRKSAAAIAETNPVIWIGKAARLSERVKRRSLCVTLESHELDRTGASIERELSTLTPAVLGSLCTAVSLAMANWRVTSEDRYPRLADATAWAAGASPALSLTPQDIVAAISPQSAAAATASAIGTPNETEPDTESRVSASVNSNSTDRPARLFWNRGPEPNAPASVISSGSPLIFSASPVAVNAPAAETSSSCPLTPASTALKADG